jgi:rSAM/selenodomain-associated transferase 1
MRGWLIVFAKAPQPGHVKTRLSPPLSHAEAAELYRCLLLDALDESSAAAAVLGCEAVIAVDPPGAAAEIASHAPAGFRAIAQGAGELGARMSHVARQAGAAGAPFALLRGSDSPCLDRGVLRDAVVALADSDLVLCPDRDGGYNLVGLGARALERGPREGLFDHPMSTPTVLRDTLARAERARLRAHRLPPGFDVDRFDDLRWLAAARHGRAVLPCRRTLAFLDERRLWPSGDPVRSSAPSSL